MRNRPSPSISALSVWETVPGRTVGPLKKLQQETKIAALCDIRSDRMQKVNEGLAEKAEMYTDYRELIKDKRVSAVAIVTPGYLHHEMVLAALRAGKDVMVEKPMAVNYREAMDIVREAKRTGQNRVLGIQRSYTAGQRQVKEIVESGRIGQVRFINYAENRNDWNAGTWKYTDPATGKSTSWRNLTKTSGSSRTRILHSRLRLHLQHYPIPSGALVRHWRRAALQRRPRHA